MKVKFTLEEEESKSLRQALEDIPTDLCGFINCPDMEGDACENCPMMAIQHKWTEFHVGIQKEILPMIEKIEG